MQIIVIKVDTQVVGYAATYAIAEESVRITHSRQTGAVFTSYPHGMTVTLPGANEVYSFELVAVMQQADHL